MGKQTNSITYLDQKEFDKNLDESLEILINDGADDKTIGLYIDDYKSRYAVKKKNLHNHHQFLKNRVRYRKLVLRVLKSLSINLFMTRKKFTIKQVILLE